MELYNRIVDKDLTIRRVNVTALNLIPENEMPEEAPKQLDMFTDYAALEKQKAEEAAADDKERRIQKTTLELQSRYGKNALLKGMNLLDGATTIMRNGQIGGHAAGQPTPATRPAPTWQLLTAPPSSLHLMPSPVTRTWSEKNSG